MPVSAGIYSEVKLCVLGDSGVGKSSIVQRFVHNTFNPAVESTIGASFLTKCMLVDDCTYKFNIWDTAGQERYRSLAPMYYRNAGAAIIVYDVTNYLFMINFPAIERQYVIPFTTEAHPEACISEQSPTFQSVKGWIRELQLHGPSSVVMAIAGNKSDLEGRREVTLKEAKEYANSVNAAIVETSALTAVNIHELFKEIALKLPKKAPPEAPKYDIRLTDEPKKKKCC